MDFDVLSDQDQPQPDQNPPSGTKDSTLPAPSLSQKLARYRDAFRAYDAPAKALRAEVDAIDIRTEEDMKGASAISIRISRALKALESARKAAISEEDQYVRAVNSLARAAKDLLDGTKTALNRKLSAGQAFMEAERRKKEEAIREEQRKAQEALEASFKQVGQEVPPEVQQSLSVAQEAALPEQQKVIRTEDGSLHFRKTWVGEIEDPKAVPREYCEPVQRLINEAVKAGVRNIPGVKFWEKPTPITR